MNQILLKQKAIDQFEKLRQQATILRWWHRLRQQPQTLLPLAPIRKHLAHLQAQPQGLKTVPLKQIVGSVQRDQDYDRQLRPLKDSLRDRWVGVSVLNETTGWPPVELLQVGNLYFIVDGHHRISVARHSGLAFVEAMVTTYALTLDFDLDNSLDDLLDRLCEVQPPNSANKDYHGAGASMPLCPCH